MIKEMKQIHYITLKKEIYRNPIFAYIQFLEFLLLEILSNFDS